MRAAHRVLRCSDMMTRVSLLSFVQLVPGELLAAVHALRPGAAVPSVSRWHVEGHSLAATCVWLADSMEALVAFYGRPTWTGASCARDAVFRVCVTGARIPLPSARIGTPQPAQRRISDSLC